MDLLYGYCGINCNECKNYLKNANCKGCRKENELLSDCFTRYCCTDKNIDFCNECNVFPCDKMKKFYNSNENRQNAFLNSINEKL